MPEFVVLPVLESIRSRPTMYLPSGQLSVWPLVSMVTDDAANFSKCHISIAVDHPFVLITSDVDWMVATSLSIDELFSRIIPRRIVGVPNLHRAEVIIRAFTAAVLTVGEGGNYADGLQLADLPDEMRIVAIAARRALAWRMPNVG